VDGYGDDGSDNWVTSAACGMDNPIPGPAELSITDAASGNGRKRSKTVTGVDSPSH